MNIIKCHKTLHYKGIKKMQYLWKIITKIVVHIKYYMYLCNVIIKIITK